MNKKIYGITDKKDRGSKRIASAGKLLVVGALIVSMLLSLLPQASVAAAEQGNRLRISSVSDLQKFARNCHLDSYSKDLTVELTQDISLKGESFEGIATFAGTFLGNGHKISDVVYTGQGYTDGFFRYITSTGLVSGLTIEGVVTSIEQQENVGGICGVNQGTIADCSFLGAVSGTTAVGGIVGVNKESGEIMACQMEGTVLGYYQTGGIAGINYGMVSGCSNTAVMNNNDAWVDQGDANSLTDIISELTTDIGSTKLVDSMDTGGICGYSQGRILNCINSGTIGYPHAGYNIGGIAGRQSGLVQSCTNDGKVYGRKDVGGIVGQMEPYVTVDEAESIRDGVEKLHDLVNKTIDDMDLTEDMIKSDTDILRKNIDAAVDTSSELTEEITTFANDNISTANTLSQRMTYVTNQLDGILTATRACITDMEHVRDDIARLQEDLDIYGNLNPEDTTTIDQAQDEISIQMTNLENALRATSDSLNIIQGIITDADGNYIPWTELTEAERTQVMEELADMAGYVSDASEATAVILNQAEIIRRTIQPYLESTRDAVSNDLTALNTDATTLLDDMDLTLSKMQAMLTYLNSLQEIAFTKLGDDFDEKSDLLQSQLDSISDAMEQLSNHADSYSKVLSEDFRQVNDQLSKVMLMFLDQIEIMENSDSLSWLYEDVSEDELSKATRGKVDRCRNNGVIAGDINTGGIAGSLSLDEEDPEGNAAGAQLLSWGSKYLTQCILSNSSNYGAVVGKEDGAGGIAGFMNLGIISGCTAYGMAESTQGDYVGGICGESTAVIRNSFASCNLSGGTYVGGIAGLGKVITNCYSMVSAQALVGRIGAIAGQLVDEEDGYTTSALGENVSGNYYVSDVLYGVDDISYEGIAEPISYQQLLHTPGVQGDVTSLRITYKVEDEIVGSTTVAYGEDLGNVTLPEITAQKGYQGEWPDLSGIIATSSMVIEAEYVRDIDTLESEEVITTSKNEEQPLGMASGTFTDQTVLHVTTGTVSPPQEIADKNEAYIYDVSIGNVTLSEKDSTKIRIYNQVGDKVQVWKYEKDQWKKVTSIQRGGYIQIEQIGNDGTYCIARQGSSLMTCLTVVGAAVLVLLLMIIIGKRKHSKEKKHARAK